MAQEPAAESPTVNEAPPGANEDTQTPNSTAAPEPMTESEPPVVGEIPVAADPVAAPSPDVTQLDTVVVTAQRRAQSLQQAPVAVTALSPTQLEQRNVQTTQDLMQVVPGLQVSTEQAGMGSGSATFFLRGMGQQRSGNGTEPAVGIYIDDVYYPSLSGSIFNFLDLQQVEVLRGPQGTLFGRNTIGGAIRYTTKDPAIFNQGFLQATGGTFNRQDLMGSANLVYQDFAAVRVTAGHLRRDGYVEVATGGPDAAAAQNDLGRLQVLLLPSEHLRINAAAKYSKNDLRGFAYNQPGPIDPQPPTLPWAYNTTSAEGTTHPPYDNRWASRCEYCQSGTEEQEYSQSESTDANLRLLWTGLEWLTVKSLSAWQRIVTNSLFDGDGSPATIARVSPTGMEGIVSQEFQFSGSLLDADLDWLAGLFGSQQYFDLPPFNSTILGNPQPIDGLNRSTDTAAGFVDATYRISDSALILAGARYSQDDKSVELVTGSGEVRDSKQKIFRSTTGRAGFQYLWSDAHMTYVSVSTGFRAGGFNLDVSGPLAAPDFRLVPFNPESVTSYEIGARSEIFGGMLRVNPTVFYALWDDIQVQYVESTAAGVVLRIENAGEAHTSGLELEIEAALSRHFLVFGNTALLRMKYDSVGNAPNITTDSKFMRAPEMTYAVGGRYQNTVGDLVNYTVNVNWSWEDEQQSAATDSDSLTLPSYGLLSSRIELAAPGGGLEVALFGTNLTDTTYYVGGSDFTASTGTRRFDLGRPREFGISARYNF